MISARRLELIRGCGVDCDRDSNRCDGCGIDGGVRCEIDGGVRDSVPCVTRPYAEPFLPFIRQTLGSQLARTQEHEEPASTATTLSMAGPNLSLAAKKSLPASHDPTMKR